MPAGFVTLSHQGMHPGVLGQPRFGQVGHRTQQADASSLEGIDRRLRGQAKMEADHRRFFFQQHLQHVGVFDE
ncbi:hypothetical protein D3C87_1580640 [compost metagenome]